MEHLESYLLGLLAQMQESNKKARVEPSAAQLPEILNRVNWDVKNILWAMCKDGKVEMHQTLNNFSFEIKKLCKIF